MEINKIYNEDCMEVLSSMPSESIDLVCTDPPYKLTSRGSSGTMYGYWATDVAKKGITIKNDGV